MVLHLGDSVEVLRTLEDRSIQTCVTSPPYWGLRDYGAEGQLGLEKTPEDFVTNLVTVFREVRRVLKNDGTLWLNLGDTYAQPLANRTKTELHSGIHKGTGASAARDSRCIPPGLKNKDLVGIPWRVAFALQADGWYLRQDIIWAKPNPMPESVRDRCTKSHEYIFLLSKSNRYQFDHEAIKEPAKYPEGPRNKKPHAKTNADGSIALRTRPNLSTIGRRDKRNKRSVWTVTTKPFKGAHFATFPIDLIEPCILAGAPIGSTVLDPFAGAGTVGVACKKLKRNFVGIELNPAYREMALARIESSK